jgi:hypothetical protein
MFAIKDKDVVPAANWKHFQSVTKPKHNEKSLRHCEVELGPT